MTVDVVGHDARPICLRLLVHWASPGGFAGGLDGGQQQGDQDGDDGDHDEELDQCEASATAGRLGSIDEPW